MAPSEADEQHRETWLLWREGCTLNPGQALELEKAVDEGGDVLANRVRLLGYHGFMKTDRRSRASAEVHALWIIEHDPRSPAMLYYPLTPNLHSAACERATALWEAHLARAEDAPLLLGAARFFAFVDRARSDDILRRGERLFPNDPAFPAGIARSHAVRSGAMLGARSGIRAVDREQAELALRAYERASVLLERHACSDPGVSMTHVRLRMAILSFGLAEFDAAEREATALLAAIEASDSLHGLVVHDANIVLGLVALERADLDAAAQHLTAAGTTRGAATLGSFGPDLVLARRLAEAGRYEAVIAYLEELRRFWDGRHLDKWIAKLRRGKVPDMGQGSRQRMKTSGGLRKWRDRMIERLRGGSEDETPR